jgi:DNA-binding NarL/FixJ family response regulator
VTVTRVLLVDDHPMVTRGLAALLEAEPGLEVVATAASREEGLAACAEHRPELVVMDVRLPDGEGVELTRRLRERFPETRVLMLSMHDDEESLFGALRAGAHGYVLKGAGHACVLRAVRSVAAGDAVFGAGVASRALQHFGAQAPPPPDPLQGLSEREREVLDLLAAGLGTKEIARRLYLSPKTVRNHIANIVAKRDLADRAHAIAYARQAGLGRPTRR